MRIAHVLASFLGGAAIQTLDMQRWSNGERLDMRAKTRWKLLKADSESNCWTVVQPLKTYGSEPSVDRWQDKVIQRIMSGEKWKFLRRKSGKGWGISVQEEKREENLE